MKKLAYIALIVAGISLVAALISRFAMTPITFGVGGKLQAEAILQFTSVCLLAAIAFILLEQK